MNNIQTKLRNRYPNYSERIDRMTSAAQEITDSKDHFESMNRIVPTLDATGAYVLGMITGEMIMDGTLHIHNIKMKPEKITIV